MKFRTARAPVEDFSDLKSGELIIGNQRTRTRSAAMERDGVRRTRGR